MLRLASLAAAVAVCVTTTSALDADVVRQRQELMRQVADVARAPMAMLKDERRFELAEVQAALKWFEISAVRLKDMFPDGSDGGSTKSLPLIWQRKSDFMARLDRMARDARAAQQAIQDEQSFKASYLKVLRNCVTCHRSYMDPP